MAAWGASSCISVEQEAENRAPNDPLPPVKTHLLPVLNPPKTASSPEDQTFKHVSPWGTFHIQITTLNQYNTLFLVSCVLVFKDILFNMCCWFIDTELTINGHITHARITEGF